MNNKTGLALSFKGKLNMTATLLRNVPKSATAVFVFAVIAMNFLARITLVTLPFVALNAGILISWVSFLFLDIITKHYGAKAANILSFVAAFANLLCCFVCFLLSYIWNYPGLDMIVGGQWSILTASTVAFILSAVSNNYTNIFIGRMFIKNPDGKAAYAVRSFISTFFSQVVDNFVFVFLAFVALPFIPGAFQVRWTVLQCIGSSVICAVFELVSEVVFSPLGYFINLKLKAKNIGKEYIEKYCVDGEIV